VITALAAGFLTFTTTNIDDMVVLTGLLAVRSYRTRNVFIGHSIGLGILIAISLFAALSALAIKKEYVGFLGIFPILLGIWRGQGQLKRSIVRKDDQNTVQPSRSGTIVPIALVILAAGGDNLSAYIPLLAAQSCPERIAIVILFTLLTGVWYFAALLIARNPRIGPGLQYWGNQIVPLFLICLGIYILGSAGSFELVSAVDNAAPSK
jgi:cadmium resistance protein CadD (predicted permease)